MLCCACMDAFCVLLVCLITIDAVTQSYCVYVYVICQCLLQVICL